jgi:eukaryotic-like serine/threonine-protein kinase
MCFWRRLLNKTHVSDRFPGYEIAKLMHKGRKSTVYQGRVLRTGGDCAIKAYNRQYNIDARQIQREYNLPSEGQIGKMVNPVGGEDPETHPIICTYDFGNEFGKSSGAYYVVLEYVSGHNLKNLITVHHDVVKERARDILAQVARGLGLLHEKNFIHRDCCSDNIMITPGWHAKIIDLGFACPAGSSFRRHSGTPTYMAPEQFGDGPLTVAADIYSFGIVAYELLTSRPPFVTDFASDDTAVMDRRVSALREQHLHQRPVPPEIAAPEISPALSACIMKCLEKKPEARYRGMAEVIAALTRSA